MEMSYLLYSSLFMPKSNTTHTSQHIDNESFNAQFSMAQTIGLDYDPSGGLRPGITKSIATKIKIDGTNLYVGKAAIGSSLSASVWQVKKIDTSSGVLITWANGDAEFDNKMDAPETLTYA